MRDLETWHSKIPVLCAYPSLFTPLEIESMTVRIIRSLTWRWTIVHPACHLHLHGRAGRQGRNISLPPCRLHPLDRAMPFAVRLPWQGGTLRASPYRGVASPACLRYCRRWGNVSLGHPLAHYSEGRQSRLKKRQGFHRWIVAFVSFVSLKKWYISLPFLKSTIPIL